MKKEELLLERECPYCNYKIKNIWETPEKYWRALAFFGEHLRSHQHEKGYGNPKQRSETLREII